VPPILEPLAARYTSAGTDLTERADHDHRLLAAWSSAASGGRSYSFKVSPLHNYVTVSLHKK
jgi:hypothetical protein